MKRGINRKDDIMKRGIRTTIGAVGTSLASAMALVTPAYASPSYTIPGKGIVDWNYSLSLYDNYQSQHLRFGTGTGTDGHTSVRYGNWAGEGKRSVAPTTNLTSQYSYGANWRQLW